MGINRRGIQTNVHVDHGTSSSYFSTTNLVVGVVATYVIYRSWGYIKSMIFGEDPPIAPAAGSTQIELRETELRGVQTQRAEPPAGLSDAELAQWWHKKDNPFASGYGYE